MRAPVKNSLENSLIVCLFFFLAASAFAEVKVFKDFPLIDGTGRPAASHSAMILNHGVMEWVAPVSGLPNPPSAHVIDFPWIYVISQ